MALKIDDTLEKEAHLVELGDAPDDKKGELLPLFAAKYNATIRALVYLITGGSKVSGKLDNPIPIVSGGTGASTTQGVFDSLALLISHNGRVFKGTRHFKVTKTAISEQGKVSSKIFIEAVDDTSFLLKGLTDFNAGALNGTEYKILPMLDELGNITYLPKAVVKPEGILITGHAPKYTTGKLSYGALMAMPDKAHFYINAK